MSWKKWSQESKEVPSGESHSNGRKEHMLKRQLPALRVFSVPVRWKKWKSPASGSAPSIPFSPLEKGEPPEEGEIQCLHVTSSKALFPQEGSTWHSRPLRNTCPRCEIVSCRQCHTLHSEGDFIAHSVLEHYDQAGSLGAGQLHRGHQRRKWN